MKKIATLLIDMQDYYIDTEEKKQLIPNQISVINFSKENNIPVIVLEMAHREETTQSLKKALNKFPKDFVYFLKKSNNDGFSNPKLDFILRSRNISILLLMGINAAYCVYATAKTAISKGYTIITSGDLIAGYDGNDETHCEDAGWYINNSIYEHSYYLIMNKINGSW